MSVFVVSTVEGVHDTNRNNILVSVCEIRSLKWSSVHVAQTLLIKAANSVAV